MSDDVATEDPKKFDLISALVGRSYPEKVVPVILDERALFLLAEAEDASAHDPANEEKSQAVEEMREALKSVTIWVRVKGVPPHIHQAIQRKVDDEFPEKPQNSVIPGVALGGVRDRHDPPGG